MLMTDIPRMELLELNANRLVGRGHPQLEFGLNVWNRNHLVVLWLWKLQWLQGRALHQGRRVAEDLRPE